MTYWKSINSPEWYIDYILVVPTANNTFHPYGAKYIASNG